MLSKLMPKQIASMGLDMHKRKQENLLLMRKGICRDVLLLIHIAKCCGVLCTRMLTEIQYNEVIVSICWTVNAFAI